MTCDPWYDELYIDLTTLMWTLVGKHHVSIDLATSGVFDDVLSHSSRWARAERPYIVVSGNSMPQKFHRLKSRVLDRNAKTAAGQFLVILTFLPRRPAALFSWCVEATCRAVPSFRSHATSNHCPQGACICSRAAHGDLVRCTMTGP